MKLIFFKNKNFWMFVLFAILLGILYMSFRPNGREGFFADAQGNTDVINGTGGLYNTISSFLRRAISSESSAPLESSTPSVYTAPSLASNSNEIPDMPCGVAISNFMNAYQADVINTFIERDHIFTSCPYVLYSFYMNKYPSRLNYKVKTDPSKIYK
jgi:hypothetical protein